jgi:hypothetical protein
MSLADIVLSLITFLLQKLILPLLPINLPFLPFATFNSMLTGSLSHNLIYSFSGLNSFFNLQLLFVFLVCMIFAEIVFWGVRAGKWIIEIIRG